MLINESRQIRTNYVQTDSKGTGTLRGGFCLLESLYSENDILNCNGNYSIEMNEIRVFSCHAINKQIKDTKHSTYQSFTNKKNLVEWGGGPSKLGAGFLTQINCDITQGK